MLHLKRVVITSPWSANDKFLAIELLVYKKQQIQTLEIKCHK